MKQILKKKYKASSVRINKITNFCFQSCDVKQCCVYFLIFFTIYFSNAVTGNSDRLTWGIWTTFSVTNDLNSFQLFTVKSIHRLLSKTKGPISLPILLLICYDKYNKNIHMTGNNNNSHFTFKVKPIWNRIFFLPYQT